MKFWVTFIILIVFVLICHTQLHAQALTGTPFIELQKGAIKINERYIDTTVAKLLLRRQEAPDSVIKGLMDLYPICKALNYTLGKINVLSSIASVLALDKKEHRAALVYLRKAYIYCLQLSKQDEREKYIVLWNSNMGAVYTHMGYSDSAMRYYYNGLNSALASNGKIQISSIYYNLSILQSNIEQYHKSIYYIQKAIELDLKKRNKISLANDYTAIAHTYINLSKLDTAKQYLQLIATLNIPKEKYSYAYMNRLYVSIYVRKNQYKKAYPYIKEVLASTDEKSLDRSYALAQLGYIHGLSKQYRESESYYKEALTVYQQSNPEGRNMRSLHDLYQSLSIVNRDMHDYKEAYSYQRLAELVNDSINKIQNIESVRQLETKYRTVEKDKALTQKELQLAKMQNDLKTRNIWLGGISAGLVIVILFTIQIAQRSKVKKQQQNVDRLKNLIEGEENERVRIGQQLHDDVMVEFSIVKMNMETLPTQFPVVGAIKEYRDIVQQLNNASIKLRHTAHNLMPDALLEEGLVSALTYFCRNVQQMTGLTIDFQHHGSIPKFAIEQEVAIYRVVQELIQNVIKHAAATEVMVQLNYWEKALNLTVEDNGRGIKDLKSSIKNGRGLNSIKTRLKAINGTMEISPSRPHGTFVDIDINL